MYIMLTIISILLFLILCVLVLISRNIAGFNANFLKAANHFNKVLANKFRDK